MITAHSVLIAIAICSLIVLVGGQIFDHVNK
jgi:hypothetical protein